MESLFRDGAQPGAPGVASWANSSGSSMNEEAKQVPAARKGTWLSEAAFFCHWNHVGSAQARDC
eukprot:3961519-Amphidinium_carterae.1